jgi:hypothetical protein
MSLRDMIATDAKNFVQETGEFGRACMYVTDAGSVPIHCTRYSDSPDARQDHAQSQEYHGKTMLSVPRALLPSVEIGACIWFPADDEEFVIIEIDRQQPHRWLLEVRKQASKARVPGRRVRP